MNRFAAAACLAATSALAVLTGAAAVSASADPYGGSAGTRQVVVRPVDSSGHARPGWTVHRLTGFKADCDGTSVAAVDDGIYGCYPSAAYLPACWPSGHHTVLCLQDPREKKLVRVRYQGSLGSATAPYSPSPLGLDLAGGQACSLRVGGAWGVLPTHRHWVGFYSCDHGSVYGPASGDGISRAAQPWTVRLWKSGTKHTVVRRTVATDYVVGTHA